MTEQYDEAVAAHYAAYRPPLHQLILQRSGIGTEQFSVGLDVGCGTGRSSAALVDFCEHVYAMDPSQSMIDAAVPHQAITYIKGSGERMPIVDQSIDIVTFAQSLQHCNPNKPSRQRNTNPQDRCHINGTASVYRLLQEERFLSQTCMGAAQTDDDRKGTHNHVECQGN